jgi:hypothetical protein
MSSFGAEAIVSEASLASSTPMIPPSGETPNVVDDRSAVGIGVRLGRGERRRTPRKSLIVVLPDNHVVSPDLVADHVSLGADGEVMDVILACAGQPHSIAALQHRVRGLQILLAPAGTTTEDLRELAMTQAPGDIVTLLSGVPVQT